MKSLMIQSLERDNAAYHFNDIVSRAHDPDLFGPHDGDHVISRIISPANMPCVLFLGCPSARTRRVTNSFAVDGQAFCSLMDDAITRDPLS